MRLQESAAMQHQLGCVLAIHDRPAEFLERALQSYRYQTVQACDKVLLDYGSPLRLSDAYRHLCERFEWRFIRFEPQEARWSLSAAYNRAVAALDPRVEIVLKSDIDILLGCNVLETAAVLGRDRLCIFSCLSTRPGTDYPGSFKCHGDLVELLRSPDQLETMCMEGVHAFPLNWFKAIGGYDLQFTGWGYEDSDLRERAKWSIGIINDTSTLLIHQWHPRSHKPEEVARNKLYYDRMKLRKEVVRNVRARRITSLAAYQVETELSC
jgi:hypothetical protein